MQQADFTCYLYFPTAELQPLSFTSFPDKPFPTLILWKWLQEVRTVLRLSRV